MFEAHKSSWEEQQAFRSQRLPFAIEYRRDPRAIIGWGIMGVVIALIVLFA